VSSLIPVKHDARMLDNDSLDHDLTREQRTYAKDGDDMGCRQDRLLGTWIADSEIEQYQLDAREGTKMHSSSVDLQAKLMPHALKRKPLYLVKIGDERDGQEQPCDKQDEESETQNEKPKSREHGLARRPVQDPRPRPRSVEQPGLSTMPERSKVCN
jgi:hypothetical protein